MPTRELPRALDRAQLKRSFADVPVGTKLLGGPLMGTNPAIFQMSISPSLRYGEYFQIWPGHPGNEIEVLGVDRSHLQLVLRVREPRRRFIQVVRKGWRWSNRPEAEAQAHAAGGRLLTETRYDWRLEMWTPEVDRRYLCGRDDLHLFIAQIPRGDTVAEAHDALKPDAVRKAAADSVRRQGEWFFLAPSEEELERLAAALRDRPRALRSAASIGPGGRPHVADSVAHIDHRVRNAHREYRRPEVYARGAVLHPDHRPLRLDAWRRVVRNAELHMEIPTASNAKRRIHWID